MNELININYENSDRPTVMGRGIHKALGVETPYTIWFERMSEYGFSEGEGFNSYKNVRVQKEGNRQVNRTVIYH